MCGITGIIHHSDREIIRDMTEIISHRGLDDFGYFSDKYISLGHRRLSIQDLSANGHQPMFTEDKRYCIIFNGEIYNHWDIRIELESKYNFRSTSDTETILYGFVEYGLQVFNKLNGVFALAIYDTHTHDLIVARDQFGVKPLYYYQQNEHFIFASEMKAILTVPGIKKDLDAKGLLQYIRFLWSPGERTPLHFVRKLLPGHYLRINVKDPGAIKVIKYYTIPFNGQYEQKTEQEWIKALDEQLFLAVKRQLLSDVPVGFFLSGGLDSSAIVAMAKRAFPDKKLRCYTIDAGQKEMEDEGFADDLNFARKVAKHLDLDLVEVEGKVDIMTDFDKMIWHLDEPQADVAPLHVYNICRRAHEDGYVVLLGGTGGDDVFSGYRRHQALRYEKHLRVIPPYMARMMKNILKNIFSHHPQIRRLKKLFTDLEKKPVERFLGYFSWISLESSKKLLSKTLVDQIDGYDSMEVLANTFRHVPEEKNLLNKMLYLELKYFLPDHNLNYSDKLGMASGVEVRVPFLDKELVEFSTRIPPELKMKGTRTKYLLKKVMERYLPREVIYRSKAGFGAPVRSWIKNILKDHHDIIFNRDIIKKEDLFDYDGVQELLKNHERKKYDATYTILSLMAIRSWYHQFIK